MKGATVENEKPLTDLDFARALKALGRVPEGLLEVTKIRENLLKQAAALEFAGCPAAAWPLQILERQFKDTEATIRTFIQVEHQSTRKATSARLRPAGRQETESEARQAAILLLCKEHKWPLDTRALAGRLERKLRKDQRFKGKDKKPLFPASRRTIARDLQTLLATTT
jgi:hypothetical protein